MFFSPQGYALLFGLLAQLAGLVATGSRILRLSLAFLGVAVVLGTCIVRHDALLFLAQLFLLPVLFVLYPASAPKKQPDGEPDV